MRYFYRGYVIRIWHDEFPQNPREDYDPLGVMICRSDRRYAIGDTGHGYNPDRYSWQELLEEILEDEKPVVVLPLYINTGGYVSISVDEDRLCGRGAELDENIDGLIIARRKDVLREFGRKKVSPRLVQQVEKVLLGEVAEYQAYLNGEIYGYTIYSAEDVGLSICELEELDCLDDLDLDNVDVDVDIDHQCGGFIGLEYCEKEAEGIIDAIWAIRNQEGNIDEPVLQNDDNSSGV